MEITEKLGFNGIDNVTIIYTFKTFVDAFRLPLVHYLGPGASNDMTVCPREIVLFYHNFVSRNITT